MPRIQPAALLMLLLAAARAPAVGGSCSVTPHTSWKSSISSEDPFVVDPWPNPRWVKFTILRCDPGRVFFQDGRQFPFHYDFATAHLDPLRGLTRSEFDARTLHLPFEYMSRSAVQSAAPLRHAAEARPNVRSPSPAVLKGDQPLSTRAPFLKHVTLTHGWAVAVVETLKSTTSP